MAVATWQDVAKALARSTSGVTPEQQDQWDHWLTGLELIIKARLGDVDELDQDTLKYVEAEAVAGKVRRTRDDGASAVTVAVDDGSVTRRYEPASADDITGEWWSLLSPGSGSSSYTVGVVSPIDVVTP